MSTTEIPPTHADILDKRCFASVATLRPDGRLSCNPVSIVWDGEKIRFSTRERTKKVRNLQADPRIALSIPDPDDPTRYVEIRGTAQLTDDDDRRFVNEIARKYMDADEYPYDPPGEKRMIVTVEIEHVSAPSIPSGS
ncbi:MAG: PPOX class F420-dependent oxidoreductase [bacterium]|nr:PPOX class F420-dependent oxidoreductase [bacterium]